MGWLLGCLYYSLLVLFIVEIGWYSWVLMYAPLWCHIFFRRIIWWPPLYILAQVLVFLVLLWLAPMTFPIIVCVFSVIGSCDILLGIPEVNMLDFSCSYTYFVLSNATNGDSLTVFKITSIRSLAEYFSAYVNDNLAILLYVGNNFTVPLTIIVFFFFAYIFGTCAFFTWPMYHPRLP